MGLNTKITSELKNEGYAREIIRNVQEMRRKANFKIDDRIIIAHKGGSSVFNNFGYLIAKETLAEKLKIGQVKNPEIKEKLKIDQQSIILEIKRTK